SRNPLLDSPTGAASLRRPRIPRRAAARPPLMSLLRHSWPRSLGLRCLFWDRVWKAWQARVARLGSAWTTRAPRPTAETRLNGKGSPAVKRGGGAVYQVAREPESFHAGGQTDKARLPSDRTELAPRRRTPEGTAGKSAWPS